MSVRAHFWLRIAGIAVILALEFGPKLIARQGTPGAPAQVARATAIAR